MIKEVEFEVHLHAAKCVMEAYKFTAQEALKVLKIPESEHARYIAAISSAE